MNAGHAPMTNSAAGGGQRTLPHAIKVDFWRLSPRGGMMSERGAKNSTEIDVRRRPRGRS